MHPKQRKSTLVIKRGQVFWEGRIVSTNRRTKLRQNSLAFPPIPPEIELEIIDQLGRQLPHDRESDKDPAVYETWRTLRACANVCQRFRHAALPYLLGSLCFYSCQYTDEEAGAFSTVFATSKAVLDRSKPSIAIATRLHTVMITAPCFGAMKTAKRPLSPIVSFQGFAKVLACLTNLKDLTLQGVAFESYPSLDDLRSTVQPLNLDNFRLEGPSFKTRVPFVDVVPVFCLLGQVKAMSLDGALASGSGEVSPPKTFTVSPTSLTLSSVDSLTVASHLMALGVLDVSKTSDVDIYQYSTRHNRLAFEALLQQTGDDLETLGVFFGPIYNCEVDSTHRCQMLTVLIGQLPDLTVCSHTIKELTISCDMGAKLTEARDIAERIGSLFEQALPPFKHLQRIDFFVDAIASTDCHQSVAHQVRNTIDNMLKSIRSAVRKMDTRCKVTAMVMEKRRSLNLRLDPGGEEGDEDEDEEQ